MLQVDIQSGLVCFSFSAFRNSLLNGAIGRNLSRCKRSLFVLQLGGRQVLLCSRLVLVCC